MPLKTFIIGRKWSFCATRKVHLLTKFKGYVLCLSIHFDLRSNE